jgi:hypothetical protein
MILGIVSKRCKAGLTSDYEESETYPSSLVRLRHVHIGRT